MKCLLTLTLLVLHTFSITATDLQDEKILFGKKEKFRFNHQIEGIIKEDSSHFYVLESKESSLFTDAKYFLCIFNRTTLKKEKTVELILPSLRYDEWEIKAKFQGIQVIGENLVLLTSYYNNELASTSVHLQKIDSDGLIDSVSIEVERIRDEEFNTWIDFLEKPCFRVITSPDQTKFTVVSTITDFDREGKQNIFQKVYNNNFELLWSSKIQTPFVHFLYQILDCQLDNKGNIFYLIKKWENSSNFYDLQKHLHSNDKDPRIYSYELLACGNDDEKFKRFDINLGTKNITDITFESGINENEITCVGFYCNKTLTFGTKWRSFAYLHSNYQDVIDGTFFFRFNKSSQEALSKKTHEFTDLYKINTNIDIDNFLDFDLNQFVTFDDGTSAIIAEQNYVNIRFSGVPRNEDQIPDFQMRDQRFLGAKTYWYHSHDILTIRFEKNGSIKWVSRIPKKQASKNDSGRFNGYVLHATKHQFNFIFLDKKNNAERLKKQLTKNEKVKPKLMLFPETSVAVTVSIDSVGVNTRKILYSSAKEKMVLVPFLSTSSSLTKTNSLYLFGIRKSPASIFLPYFIRRYNFSRIVFD